VSATAERAGAWSAADDRRAGAARGPVILVILGETVSRSAIGRAAELAAGQPVTVMAIECAVPGRAGRAGRPGRPGPPDGGAGHERVRRVVATAMSSLEDLGATALGHISVTRAPGRILARAVRTRGATAVVLDQLAPAGWGQPVAAGLTAELRRRLHGSGIIVETTAHD
jgi:hypothetical protein